jgi:hypothetical protein
VFTSPTVISDISVAEESGEAAWVAAAEGGTGLAVWHMRPDGPPEQSQVKVPRARVRGLAISPDGTRFAILTQAGVLSVSDLRTGVTQQPALPPGPTPAGFWWAEGGGSLLVLRGEKRLDLVPVAPQTGSRRR